MRIFRYCFILSVLLFALACSDDAPSDEGRDTGSAPDASDALSDAHQADDAGAPDANIDEDAGAPDDAGTPDDVSNVGDATDATDASDADATDATDATDPEDASDTGTPDTQEPVCDLACDTPPADTCADADTLRSFSAPGLCEDAACTYDFVDTACAFGCENGACKAPDNFLISEVYYDAPGADKESFIEVYGPANTAVDGLRLVAVNGNGGGEYATIDLIGQTNSEGFFVVMQPSAPAEWLALADQLDNKADLQNGPDSVQLRFGEQVIDALAYGEFSATEVAAGLGEPAVDAPAGQSLSRDENMTNTHDNFSDFQLADPSPGVGFSLPSCTDACTQGSTVCDGESALKTCEMQASGCLDWSAPVACSASQTCSAGACQDTVDPDDWFDPQSCSGAAWSAADALARLNSSSSVVLDSQTVLERSRTCDANGCGPWSAPQPNSIRYLTWSGGVTTRYTTLQTDTTLVLFNDNGTPKLSVRHDTHLAKYPDDHDQGIVFGLPAATVRFPRMRAWKMPPSQHPYDYQDLDNYLGRDAQLHVSANCARFESVSPARDPASEQVEQFVAVYRF